MSVFRTAIVTAAMLGLTGLGLAGCATVEKTRDAIVKRPTVCTDQTVQIYFETDSAEVTPEGQAVIRQAAAQAKGCTVKRVDVVGLADASGAGTPDANLALSKRRAQSVTAALASAGLPAGEFNVAAAGQTGATTRGGESRPLRRRADIILRLTN
jgi:peptidoglycan-associated lipoprotein